MNKYLIPFLFVLSMLALDFHPATTDIFRDGKIRAFLLMGSFFLFLYYSKIIGVGMAALVSYSIAQMIVFNYPIYGYFSVSLMAIVPFIAYELVKRLKTELVSKLIVFVALLQAIHGILQFYFGIHIGFKPLMAQDMFEVVGTMGQHTVLGSFLALCLAPALWNRAYLTSALIIWCTFLSLSSMAIGTVFFVIGMYLWSIFGLKRCILFYSVVATCGISVYLYDHDLYFYSTAHSIFNSLGRSVIWPAVVPAIKENPMFGGGVGYFSYWSMVHIGTKFGPAIWDKLHCDPYQMVIEQGLLGLSMCAYALFEFFKKMKLQWPQVLVLAMLINSVANFPFHLMTHAILFCIAWIISLSLKDEGAEYVHD